MALATTIKEGATTVAASGGTDVTLVSLGIQGNTNTFTFSTDLVNLTRRLLKCSVKPESVSASAPGGFTQRRESFVLSFPRVLANGNRTIDTVRVEVAHDPSTTDADVESMCEQSAQILGTAAFMDFYKRQNLN